MILISFVVPCYNSQDYMRRCIDSILPAKRQFEIIIVNDGSTDATGDIAEAYRRRYPGIVRVVHQQNQGHGEGVNQGVRHARGLFFKVVDSDDWLDRKSLHLLMKTLRHLAAQNTLPDMVVCNYVRVRLSEGRKHEVRFSSGLPAGRMLQWADIRPLGRHKNLLMHAIVYRTKLLHECNVRLPKHTFYVDCLFSHLPIYNVQTLYYLNLPLYQYLIGRPGQTVENSVMLRNVGHVVQICRAMVDAYLRNTAPLEENQKILLLDDIGMMLCNATLHLLMLGTPWALQQKQQMWDGIRAADSTMYRYLRNHWLGILCTLPHPVANRLGVPLYHFINKYVPIN